MSVAYSSPWRARQRLFGPLQIAQWLPVHFIDDPGVGARRGLETGPRHRVRRFLVGVKAVVELARRHSWHAAEDVVAVEPNEDQRATSFCPWHLRVMFR